MPNEFLREAYMPWRTSAQTNPCRGNEIPADVASAGGICGEIAGSSRAQDRRRRIRHNSCGVKGPLRTDCKTYGCTTAQPRDNVATRRAQKPRPDAHGHLAPAMGRRIQSPGPARAQAGTRHTLQRSSISHQHSGQGSGSMLRHHLNSP